MTRAFLRFELTSRPCCAFCLVFFVLIDRLEYFGFGFTAPNRIIASYFLEQGYVLFPVYIMTPHLVALLPLQNTEVSHNLLLAKKIKKKKEV